MRMVSTFYWFGAGLTLGAVWSKFGVESAIIAAGVIIMAFAAVSALRSP